MKNMSFALTPQQLLDGSKDVTRRVGWDELEHGDLVRACLKCMGLKKGEKLEVLGVIQVMSKRREPLRRMTDQPEYGQRECRREGFPEMSPAEFVAMFCRANKGCTPDSVVTRIQFKFLAAGAHPHD